MAKDKRKSGAKEGRATVDKMDSARMDFLLSWQAVRRQLFKRFPVGSLVEWEDDGVKTGIVRDPLSGYDVMGDPCLAVVYLRDDFVNEAKLTLAWAKRVKLRVLGRARIVLDPATANKGPRWTRP